MQRMAPLETPDLALPPRGAFRGIVGGVQILVTILFLLAALINLAPVTGVVSAERLQALYGIPIEGPDLEILMRHRAILFGIVGVFLVVAAFHPPTRNLALVVGLVSMVSYIIVALGVGGYNASLQRIVWVDVAGIVFLVLGWALGAMTRT